MSYILKNSDLSDCWLASSAKNKIPVIYKYLKRQIGESNLKNKKVKQSINWFASKIQKFWKESKYNVNYFEKKHCKWLSQPFFISDNVSIIHFLI